jgi:hypothetical protein
MALARVLKKHQGIVNLLRGEFEKSTTRNIAKSLHETEKVEEALPKEDSMPVMEALRMCLRLHRDLCIERGAGLPAKQFDMMLKVAERANNYEELLEESKYLR